MTALPLVLLGILVGSYGTIIGAGGGFLLVPALLALYPTESAASLTSLSLAIVALNASSGTLAYAWRRRIDYRLGLVLAAASVPGTMAGASLTRHVPRGVFDAAFGVILLLLGVFLLWRPAREAMTGADGVAVRRAPRAALAASLSAVIGWLSGVMGIGGSPFQVVVLTHVLRVSAATAMPTVQFMVLLSALGGVLIHAVPGQLGPDPVRFVVLGGGVLVGAQMGAALSERVSSGSLMRMLALALLSVSAHLILKAIR